GKVIRAFRPSPNTVVPIGVARSILPILAGKGQMPARPGCKYLAGKTLDGEPAGTANCGVPVKAWWGCSTRSLTHAVKRLPLERPRNVAVPMASRQALDAAARFAGKHIGVRKTRSRAFAGRSTRSESTPCSAVVFLDDLADQLGGLAPGQVVAPAPAPLEKRLLSRCRGSSPPVLYRLIDEQAGGEPAEREPEGHAQESQVLELSVRHGSAVRPQVGHDRFLLDRARPLGPGYCVGPSLSFRAGCLMMVAARGRPALPGHPLRLLVPRSPAPTSPTSRRSPSAVLTSPPPRS